MPAKKTKKRNPRSEAAMREAYKLVRQGSAILEVYHQDDPNEVTAYSRGDYSCIAIFPLHMCFTKRAPLKGIGKKLTKLVRAGK